MLNAHPNECIRTLGRKDVNGLTMVECTACETVAHAADEPKAKADLANASCSPNCDNCKRLRRSHDRAPAVPTGGSCHDRLHICPNDGNKWWQTNNHFHLWNQVTSEREWELLQKE